jgi:RimJ/RimL family protein N-acetyltransferase
VLQIADQSSRGLKPLAPSLADDTIRLDPLDETHVPEFVELIADEDVQRFTLVPSGAGEAFVRDWIAHYEAGWEGGSSAGFCIHDVSDGAFLGFAAIVALELDARQGELGYMVAPAARGRGTSVRAVGLLTRWAFDDLGLERLELRIDVANAASERVARRAGYRRDGVLRNAHFKEGMRSDTGVWSRLRSD